MLSAVIKPRPTLKTNLINLLHTEFSIQFSNNITFWSHRMQYFMFMIYDVLVFQMVLSKWYSILCPRKVSQTFLSTLTSKDANRIPFNSANSVSNQCLTMWHKNYPLHLIYVCTLPCKVMRVKIDKKCDFAFVISQNSRVKTITIFCQLSVHHLFALVPRTCKVFTIHFNTCCQIVTPLLFCLKLLSFGWLLHEITLFCHNSVSRNITR